MYIYFLGKSVSRRGSEEGNEVRFRVTTELFVRSHLVLHRQVDRGEDTHWQEGFVVSVETTCGVLRMAEITRGQKTTTS